MIKLTTKNFMILLGVYCVLHVVVGLSITGSPAKGLEIKRDNERLNDIKSIGAFINDYYSVNQDLPNSLSDLSAYSFSKDLFLDPVDSKPYEYIKNTNSFRICTSFDMNVEDLSENSSFYFDRSDYINENIAFYADWNFSKGYSCINFSKRK